MTSQEIAAHEKGFTREYNIGAGAYDLHVMVRPEQDFDDRFPAFDIESGEWIAINGWLIEYVEPCEAYSAQWQQA